MEAVRRPRPTVTHTSIGLVYGPFRHRVSVSRIFSRIVQLYPMRLFGPISSNGTLDDEFRPRTLEHLLPEPSRPAQAKCKLSLTIVTYTSPSLPVSCWKLPLITFGLTCDFHDFLQYATISLRGIGHPTHSLQLPFDPHLNAPRVTYISYNVKRFPWTPHNVQQHPPPSPTSPIPLCRNEGLGLRSSSTNDVECRIAKR